MYYSMVAKEGSRTPDAGSTAGASGRPFGGPSGSASAGPSAFAEPATEVLDAEERARLIDEIRALEELKSAASAAQARAAAVFDASTRREQARAGVKKEQLGRGVAAQLALARRESAFNGTKLLGLARILTTEMPCTLAALSAGVISEWRATILVRETACLSAEDRGRVDELIAGDPAGLEQLGDRKLVARIKSLSYGLDPHSVVNRASKAASERFVSCRPAPDTMTYVTGLLPVAQGVGVFAALTREADRLRAAGDARTKGQIMADTLVQRVTGQARAEDVRVEVQLIMTDQTLLHGILPQTGKPAGMSVGSAGTTAGAFGATTAGRAGGAAGSTAGLVPEGAEPAVLAGYGIVPAQWARDLIRGANRGTDPSGPDKRTEIWLRRLYTAPDSGRLTAMDSRARLVPDGLARFIAARDQVCRMPWCGAPIRHYDHIKPVRDGGETSAGNIQGLCEACNQAKEAPGWTAREIVDAGVEGAGDQNIGDRDVGNSPPDPHTVETITPTGRVYRSTAPPPPGPVLRR